LLQALVLGGAAAQPRLLEPRATPALLEACLEAGLLEAAVADALAAAHARLVGLGLERTLDRRARLVPVDSEGLDAARVAIRAAFAAADLAAGAGITPPD